MIDRQKRLDQSDDFLAGVIAAFTQARDSGVSSAPPASVTANATSVASRQPLRQVP